MDNHWNEAANSLAKAVLTKVSHMEHGELHNLLPELFEQGGALANAGDNELCALQALIAQGQVGF
ncbi:hypothetical protein ACFFU8_09330 [Chromobacterium piscinae]|uniref:hypothetical protein n=1 Tax=Chromobacterium piscinae TaxID=686831 RepID=UPI001E6331B1|nr:hypothetical protein [Chromobacterium piscinae]MCD5327894.1 hypothetical protein [Chromobacterium piscinae]